MNELTESERKVLRHFFGAYFHEDWNLDSSTSDEAVTLYMLDSAEDRIGCLKSAILHLTEGDSDDTALEEVLLRDFGCYFSPSGAGIAVRVWLLSIVAVLSSKPQ